MIPQLFNFEVLSNMAVGIAQSAMGPYIGLAMALMCIDAFYGFVTDRETREREARAAERRLKRMQRNQERWEGRQIIRAHEKAQEAYFNAGPYDRQEAYDSALRDSVADYQKRRKVRLDRL